MLAFLHEQHLIHRDVKPSNLLLTSEGDLKLADLGLAGRLDRLDDPEGGTVGVGTPGYMAPEHAAGGDPMPAWDLFSLGVTVRQLLTGARPAPGRENQRAAGELPTVVPAVRRAAAGARSDGPLADRARGAGGLRSAAHRLTAGIKTSFSILDFGLPSAR